MGHRHLGQTAGVAASPGSFGSSSQHLAVAAIPGVVKGVAERHLEVAAQYRIGVGDQVEGGEGPFVVAGGLLEGQAVAGSISRLAGVVDPPGGLAERGRLDEMAGQFGSAAPTRRSSARPIFRCSRIRATVGNSS